ncbi:unnamed protein product [Nezara viridula]|uniref:Uncharacterized protein n=1 Tax=Nezara viridula TaxID=85310 RepID=A0A9P0E761_NEZVI|nr:unnamed protein product [Nezara viridula]
MVREQWLLEKEEIPFENNKSCLGKSRVPLQLTRPSQLRRSCGSPDLSPLDYRFWSELERMAYHRAHPNL